MNLINFNKLIKEIIILNKSIKQIKNILKLNIFSLKQIKTNYKLLKNYKILNFSIF